MISVVVLPYSNELAFKSGRFLSVGARGGDGEGAGR